MLELTQFESNLVHWTKHHYEEHNDRNFWSQLGAIYMEQYLMDAPYLDGIYHMVRSLWEKILKELPQREFLMGEYENGTLPSNAWKYFGGKKVNSGIFYNPKTDVYNDEDIYRARIACMCSQISLTEVKYYRLMPKQEFAGLKFKNPVD